MSSIRTTVTLCLVFVAFVLGLFVTSIMREDVLDEAELRELGVFVLPRPRELSPFDLQKATGEPFTREDLEGDWHFLFFGFTHCPDICPVSMSVMGQAERLLLESNEKPFKGVLVTVDPNRDDAATLAAYTSAFSESFTGVRGEIRDLAEFGRELNVAFAAVPDGEGGYTVDHSGNIVVVNPKGHYHGFIKMPHTADTIVQTYRSLRASF